MRAMVLTGVVSVVLGLVGPVRAEAPPGPFQEAGRLVDQLTGRLGSLGAELVQQMQRGHPGPFGRGMPEPADRPLITIMLHHQGELGLSADQVNRLEALRTEFTREAIRRDADIRITELDLTALLEQEPADLAKVEAKVREAAQLRADLRIARLRTIEQGKAVLTAEQRARLQSLLGEGMHHGSGRPAGPPAPRRSADSGTRL